MKKKKKWTRSVEINAGKPKIFKTIVSALVINVTQVENNQLNKLYLAIILLYIFWYMIISINFIPFLKAISFYFAPHERPSL